MTRGPLRKQLRETKEKDQRKHYCSKPEQYVNIRLMTSVQLPTPLRTGKSLNTGGVGLRGLGLYSPGSSASFPPRLWLLSEFNALCRKGGRRMDGRREGGEMEGGEGRGTWAGMGMVRVFFLDIVKARSLFIT